MSAPVILLTSPVDLANDVALGQPIKVTFDQVIDTDTYDGSTFVLMGPGSTRLVSGDQLLAEIPDPLVSVEPIAGTFSFFTNGSNQTEATFTPNSPLRPGVEYTVLIAGSTSILALNVVKNSIPESMANSVQFGFITTTLDLISPPPVSPLPTATPHIDVDSIVVTPSSPQDNDLAAQIKIVFPSDIDQASISASDIQVALEAVLNDPDVIIPVGVTATVNIDNNEITIDLVGLPI